MVYRLWLSAQHIAQIISAWKLGEGFIETPKSVQSTHHKRKAHFLALAEYLGSSKYDDVNKF